MCEGQNVGDATTFTKVNKPVQRVSRKRDVLAHLHLRTDWDGGTNDWDTVHKQVLTPESGPKVKGQKTLQTTAQNHPVKLKT
eukprot:3714980-Amphidinium_carterae.1